MPLSLVAGSRINVRSIGIVLGGLQLATSLSLYGVFWEPWRWLLVRSLSGELRATMFVASMLFILLPIAALPGIWRHRRFGWYALCGFPAITRIFGTVPIPFASYAYSEDVRLNSTGITIVDILAIAVAVALMMKWQARPGGSPR